jgi:glucan endo-1,3-alpha-glucosidase
LILTKTYTDTTDKTKVGNWQNFTIDLWKTHMTLAQSVGIDGFALNTAPNTEPNTSGLSGNIANQLSYAFTAAQQLGSTFKLFIAFDYLGAGPDNPWKQEDVITTLVLYTNHSAYFQYTSNTTSGAYVSTFEGTNNINDWKGIKDAVPGSIFFVPDWTSLGPEGIKSHFDIIDGAFSWDMWPQGPFDMTSDNDKAWKAALGDRHFMMGISPWFYTKLPGYQKTWVWRGDDLWHTRWDQIAEVKPDMVQIVTWNDYGESHYIGPIYDPGVPNMPNANAHPYIDGMPHEHWQDLLPYYIARLKSPDVAPPIPKEMLQYWYRLTPAAAGRADGVTGSNGPTFDPNTIVQDKVFVTALVNAPANISVQIMNNTAMTFWAASAGANHFSQPFNGQTGPVTFSIVRNGQIVVSGTGEAIQASPGGDGATNYNAWVGGASA